MKVEDLESQIDELTALRSIYDETCFRTSRSLDGLTPDQIKEDELLSGFFSAEINSDSPLLVKLKSVARRGSPIQGGGGGCGGDGDSTGSRGDQSNSNHDPRGTEGDQSHSDQSVSISTVTLSVSSLPPLRLDFEFPSSYPSSSAPRFALASRWMPRRMLSRVTRRLDELWRENQGMEIVFTWTSFLRDDLVDFLSLKETVDLTEDDDDDDDDDVDPRCARDIGGADLLLPVIREHDEAAREKLFKSSVFECHVCFDEQLGSNCLQFLPCNHVFCNSCMAEYFKVQIRGGSVQCLTCPEDDCASVALPSQVKALVPPDLFADYDRLLLQTTLDTMVDVLYCPRKTCSSPVLLEPGGTMAICSVCKFAFCYFCRMTYHGVAPCRLKTARFKEIREEYLAADAATKADLDRRYGRATLRRVFEEQESENYVERNCKRCPGCGANVSKIEGCNKMTCGHCKRYFCWLCGALLPKAHPYLHFNAPGGGCYNKLFEGENEEDDDDDWEFEDWEDDDDDDEGIVFA